MQTGEHASLLLCAFQSYILFPAGLFSRNQTKPRVTYDLNIKNQSLTTNNGIDIGTLLRRKNTDSHW